jgi:hypothetical protein
MQVVDSPAAQRSITSTRTMFTIGPRSLVPLWHGDNMDDGMSVDGLIRRE